MAKRRGLCRSTYRRDAAAALPCALHATTITGQAPLSSSR